MAESQIFRVMFRWGLGDWKTPEEALTHRLPLHEWVVTHSKKFIYQLERGKENGFLHFQGYASLKDKVRPQTMAKSLNGQFRGIEIQPCHDEEALKKYSMKSDTRVDGPWTDRPILEMEETLDEKSSLPLAGQSSAVYHE